MKTLEQIFDIIEGKEISIDNYTEDEKLCGYELNTYTAGGVNEIIFLDFRNSEFEPTNVDDFITVINERINDIDIDDEIENYRQDKRYRQAFTLSQSLEDFTDWKNGLDKMLEEINL